MCKVNPAQMCNCENVMHPSLRNSLIKTRNEHQLFGRKTPGRREAKFILRKVEATIGSTCATNEERKRCRRRAWKITAKFHSAEMFITVTPNETDIATVACFSVESP